MGSALAGTHVRHGPVVISVMGGESAAGIQCPGRRIVLFHLEVEAGGAADGRDLGKDAGIGNNQQLQEIYGRGQTLHLTVFALHQDFFGGRLEWRFGRLPVGEDFASFPCDFQNLSFCGAPAGNIVGDYWINWPTS